MADWFTWSELLYALIGAFVLFVVALPVIIARAYGGAISLVQTGDRVVAVRGTYKNKKGVVRSVNLTEQTCKIAIDGKDKVSGSIPFKDLKPDK